jgi:transcriptional regulator with XRE-family HTH domain
MCADLGISRGNISDLKMGRIESLSADKLAKIATYFKVSVDYLLTGTETKKAPTQEGERDIDDRKIKAAFLGGLADGLSDEEIDEYWDDARDYIGYKIQQKKNKPD